MAEGDFFGQDDPQDQPVDEVSEDTSQEIEEQPTVKIGDEEFSLEEAENLISLGKIGKEAEEKFNTKIENVWPDYSRTKNELKEYKSKETEVEPQVDDVVADQMTQVKDLLRNNGFYTKEDIDKYMEEREAAQNILSDAKRLEGQYDGSDGRPKADAVEVLQYMQETGIQNPETAYKVMHEKELDAWKSTQLGKAKKPDMVTDKTAPVDKEPQKRTLDNSNLGDAIRESLTMPGA